MTNTKTGPATGPKAAEILSKEANELMHIANDAALDLKDTDLASALNAQAICNALFAVSKEIRALRASFDQCVADSGSKEVSNQ